MSLILDTGVLYSYYDRKDSWHSRSVDLIRQEKEGLVIPAPVLPEADYLLGRRLGAKAREALYQGLVEGHFFVADLHHDSYSRVLELNRQFADFELGFVDAAVIAIAETLGIARVATTDRRHFRAVAARLGLQLLP